MRIFTFCFFFLLFLNFSNAQSNKNATSNRSIGGILGMEDDEMPQRPDISVFPNPAIDDVRFDVQNLPYSNYIIKIFNILGTIVWKNEIEMSGDKNIKVDLTRLKKGTYLYALQDMRSGRIIVTKRLLIIRP